MGRPPREPIPLLTPQGVYPITLRIPRTRPESHVLLTEAKRAAEEAARPEVVPIKYTFLDAFIPHNDQRKEWQAQRCEELLHAHGYVSSGVGRLIGLAAWHHAAAEFAHELGARTGDLDAFNMATRFSNAARSSQLAAWDLAAREAQQRRINDPSAGNTMGELLTQIEDPPLDPDGDPEPSNE